MTAMIFDPMYFVYVSPAIILALWAQYRVKSTYHRAQQVPAGLTGAAAAQHILDQAGVEGVGIEQTHGVLSDHYDPRHRMLRLSPDVYSGRNAAAVGIAAHEVGHALQHAQHYAPLVVRNLAVPMASFGSGIAPFLLILGFMMQAPFLIKIGIIGFACVVFFQVINLPVEFNASTRAKQALTQLGMVDTEGATAVRSVLNAAALTYVAATLQAILTLLYYLMRFSGSSRDE